MDNILSKKHYRRSFFTVVTLVLVIAFFVRFIGVPHFDPNAKVDLTTFAVSILDTLTVSLLITVFIGSFVFWLTPEIIKKSTMDVIEPKEINPLFKKAAADTKTWIIKGACGRYTRAVTIPSLAQSAKHEGIGRDIRIIMLDPAEIDTCEEYANYRRSLKSASTRGPWTKEKVQEEVIATVLTALQFKYKEPLLTINIHLASTFSAFRLDISDSYVIVTKEDKEAAGLRADAGTYFYNSYKDETRLIERQSKKVQFDRPVEINKNTSKKDLKRLIIDVGLLSEQEVELVSLENILSFINDPKEPYSK
ncbi:hypothetical protein ACSVJV_003651 [Vibrio cholerae]|uniref:hypothetical protein n=1 Tax=Vibrio cholerae TaxID=666 RepID=UPI000ECFCC7C|nr:hypothetical protein [Vibrio cholerae]EKF9125290.1 hypothetical protein [Vibrio cholerae]EKF9143607.1 hypothetical protein [Vibrio cholerae]ELH5152407.1 hypothetical protein [Vibrio cholerae]QKU91049.1 hypothetical protein HPY16_15655 [Vibrio cholerae]RJL25686.1 hypothetical protein D5R89_16765 [Vibrio cholerae]